MKVELTGRHAGMERGFVHYSESWYAKRCNTLAKDVVDQVLVGIYHPEGGTTGEFSFEWVNIGPKITPKLKAYDDAWDALKFFPDLLSLMSEIDGADIPPMEFCQRLIDLGLTDRTARDDPYK